MRPIKSVDHEGKEIFIQPQRVMDSVLPRIRQIQSEETYKYAEKLFERMDILENEIKKKEDELYTCNKVLTRLVFNTVNIEDSRVDSGNK